jgi:hypothetical protein
VVISFLIPFFLPQKLFFLLYYEKKVKKNKIIRISSLPISTNSQHDDVKKSVCMPDTLAGHFCNLFFVNIILFFSVIRLNISLYIFILKIACVN